MSYLLSIISLTVITARVLKKIILKKPTGLTKPAQLISLFLVLLIFIQSHIILGKILGLTPEIIPGDIALTGIKPDAKLEFTFRSPIDMKMLIINSQPPVKGTWKKNQYARFLPYGRKVEFIPAHNYMPNSKLMVYFSNITKPFSREWGGEYLFETQVLKGGSFAAISGDQEGFIPADGFLKLTLTDKEAGSLFTIESSPSATISLTPLGQTEYAINFPQRLRHGQRYWFTLYETPVIRNLETKAVVLSLDKTAVHTFSLEMAKPPLIADYYPPPKQAALDSKIIIGFDQVMDATATLDIVEITPDIPGNVSWSEDKKKLIFTPEQNLTRKTYYTIKLKPGLKTASGGILEQSQIYAFETIGPPEIIMTSPSDGANQIAQDSLIRISFDQPVDEKLAESLIQIIPETKGSFSWIDNTAIFHPEKPLENNTDYFVTIKPGIVNKLGMNTEKLISFRFTTQPGETRLTVPYYRQEENFTCNIAALRMLLAYRGINQKEADLKLAAGTDGVRGSGDPQKGYVTNYGTYWTAIHKLAASFRPARILTNQSLTDLLQEISAGNPFMIWGQNGWSDPHEISWTTPEGNFIYAINGMHSYVVTGFSGSITDPKQIFVNDPWRGQYNMNRDTFTRLYGYFKTALVVD
jgi:uncharacterized protein YvpB